MLPGVQITIVAIVVLVAVILLLFCIETTIFLLVELIEDRRERKVKRYRHLTKREAQKILEMVEEELLKQRDDNIHTNC